MKRFATFALVVVAVIVVLAFAISLAVRGDGAARAIWTSAVLAMAVQCAAFGITRAVQPAHVMAAWGGGMVLRFLALAVFGLFGVKAMGLAQAPALLSLAAFLFVTTMIEPVFLKQ